MKLNKNKIIIILILLIVFLILHTIVILRARKAHLKTVPSFYKTETEIYQNMVIEQQKDIDFYHKLLQQRSLRKAKKSTSTKNVLGI